MKVEIQPGRSREAREKMGEVKEDSRFVFGIPDFEKIDQSKKEKGRMK
jgi:hypothetical protein